MFKIIPLIAAIALGTYVSAAVASAAPVEDYKETALKAREGKRMKRSEVRNLYRDKTWVWDNEGGGYFSKKLRFMAISNSDGNENYAAGRWFLTLKGRMCFRAIWISDNSKFAHINCFSHRKAGDVIYQRPGRGGWYTFKHGIPLASDEFKKLKEGNLIAKEFMARKARIKNKRTRN